MLIGDDRLSPDRAGTCSATSPETVCPRCGRSMAIAKTGMFKVVATAPSSPSSASAPR